MENIKTIIAGGGTGGLSAAIELAKKRYSVTLLEAKAKEEYLTSHDWSDAVEFKALQEAGYEMPIAAEDKFVGTLVKTYPEGNGLFEPHRINPLHIFDPEYRVRTKDPAQFEYIITDRKALREMQLREAEELGVKIYFDSPVISLLGDLNKPLGDIFVNGVKALINNKEVELSADLVIDSTGANSALRSQLGAPEINMKFPENEYNFAYRTVRRFSTDIAEGLEDKTFCDHYRYVTHKGYFWIHIHDEGIVDVGGGTPAKGKVRTDDIVNEMVSSHPCISDEEIRGGYGMVHIGFAPESIVASGFVALGDSASMVNPANGCGVGGSLIAAKNLANILTKASSTGIADLWEYAALWYRQRGANYAALYASNEIITSLSHDDIYQLMKLNIMGGGMLNYNLNGLFPKVNASSALRMIKLLFKDSKLFGTLIKANKTGTKTYRHYTHYPQKWSPLALKDWIEEKKFCNA